ncbi:MAG: dihydrolipoyl dehydrogenase family protein [Armatimonadota bacterium]|jgi:pyruvate/2-oxoglutarate dehydrogenase complex dihydrolipoamide dehydrogenase (E3) component
MSGNAWDLVVIGGGAGGNGAAGLAGKLGFKTALIEQDRLGGACMWVACVPSKALLQAAAEYWRLQHGPRAGIRLRADEIDPSGALQWVREITNRLASEARPEKLADRGVEFLRGTAAFAGPDAVRVGEHILRTRRTVIATGSRPAVPAIDGLEASGYLTNLTLFDLPEPPRSLIIIGAGPVGMEMAQAFNRLGTTVTVIERSNRVLERDEAELAAMLRDHLTEEGVHFALDADVLRVERIRGGARVVTALVAGEQLTFEADELLVATGREAAVDGLALDDAGVAWSAGGIPVNDRLQTDNPEVYAVGDVLGRWQFTHMATIEGKHAARNALLGEREPFSYDAAGWCTFTDPALASVGLTEAQARERGLDCEVHRIKPTLLDRARIEGHPEGAAKIIAEPDGGRIFGAQILAAHAGEIIQEFVAAVTHGVPFRALAEDVHPYPGLTLAHYVPGQMDWLRAAHDPDWLEQIRREAGFAGRSDG